MTNGVVVWVTGLPSSGKSLFAERLRAALSERGTPGCLLDGDEVRKALAPEPGYEPAARADFYETLSRLASLLARQGLVVVVAATANLRSFRERARALAPAYFEVFVATSLADCEKRDTKGLYAAARAGRRRDVPGIDAPFEPPLAPDVTATGGTDAAALGAVLQKLVRSTGTGGLAEPPDGTP
ncbi:MAG TPA: adenylyl-sulfate kinase [Polyangiaceae bacterium]|jgi:adenylylsulfate kinase|nr:adenylyl-sulfate kinase [Polyangiaceae bacterium]